MVRIEFNGKPFDPEELKDAFMAAALQQLGAQIQERVGSIRDPETGEFPTVVVRAKSLSDIQLQIEGSDAMIKRVRRVLELDEPPTESAEKLIQGNDPDLDQHLPTPHVFLSYASEDRVLAERIARVLRDNGIETWWDRWEIRAGDSLRRKIEEGMGDCTHFLVLLTPTSLLKPWVNVEIDAGFMRLLNKRIVFIPLRSELAIAQLPIFLQCMSSPEIVDFEADLRQLIHDIHGVTRKPVLGPKPKAARTESRPSGYSTAANAIARIFVEATGAAVGLDPQMSSTQLLESTSLSRNDLDDALFELRNFVEVHEYSGGDYICARPELYTEFDANWQPWTPADDALRLATDLVNDPEFPSNPSAIVERYGWSARRLNPAVTYLRERNAIEVRNGIGIRDFLVHSVLATGATRRFLKSRS